MSDEKAGCETCKFLRRQDYGYSNWTVEGATLDCLKRLHPMEEIDDQFESRAFAEAMAFGATCAGRVEGDGPYFDCDGETTVEEYKGDAELYALLTPSA